MNPSPQSVYLSITAGGGGGGQSGGPGDRDLLVQTVATRSVVESGDGGSILIRSTGLKARSGFGSAGRSAALGSGSGSCSGSDMSVPPATEDRDMFQVHPSGMPVDGEP